MLEDAERNALHGKQGQCLLLLERHSRYGDNAAILPAELAAHEHTCRIIVSIKQSQVQKPTQEEVARNKICQPSLRDYAGCLKDSISRKFIGAAIKPLLSDGSRVWCMGEVGVLQAEALRLFYREKLACLPVFFDRMFVVFSLSAKELDEDTIWPYFQGEDSPRIFLSKGSVTELRAYLDTIYQLSLAKDKLALEYWKRISEMCLRREGVETLCKDFQYCILPDGPYFQQFAFHSLRPNLEAMRTSLLEACTNSNLACTVIEDEEAGFSLL